MSKTAFSALQARPAVVQPTSPTNSNVLRFTSSTTAASQALPRTAAAGADWRGKDVEIINENATAANFIFFAFSKTAAVTLVNTAAGANGAPTATRGEFLGAGQRIRRSIPAADPNGTGATGEDVFFNWIAAAGTPDVSLVLVEHDR